jgi:hypothetical protein
MSHYHSAASLDTLYIVQYALGRKGDLCKLELVGHWCFRAVWIERVFILINCTISCISQCHTVVLFDILYVVQCAVDRKGIMCKLELVGCRG